MDFIPEKSELQVDNLDLKDKVVREMVKEIGLKKLIPGKRERQPKEWGAPLSPRPHVFTSTVWSWRGASATIHSFFLKEEGSGAGRQFLVRALNYRSFLLK